MTSAVLAAPKRKPNTTIETIYVTPAEVRLIGTAADLRSLLGLIQERGRRVPVIVTSPHGKAPLVRLGTVREVVGDQAIFAELTNQTAADWRDQWPDACAFGGAIRLFAPRTAHRSRLLRSYPDDDLRDVEDQIVTWIRKEQWRTDPAQAITPCKPSKSQDIPPRRDAVIEEVRRHEKQQIEQLSRQNREFREMVRGVNLFADPVDQFRFEIGFAYLRFMPECDRARWPLPEDWATFGEFLGQVDDHAKSIGRETILRAVVDVLTGRARETGRQVRAHRTGRGGNDPTVVRADGARALRCNVQTNTAAARRLIWWQHLDNHIELASIAAHDKSGV